MNNIINKSDFMLYLDAPRHLWAKKHNQYKRKEDDFSKHLSTQGYEVEKLAEKYIREYLIPKYNIDPSDFLSQPTKTDEHYEARTDFLLKNSKTGKWDMYEVKSSTSVKKEHKYDATFQVLVFEKHYDIGDIYILHPNKEYIKDGDISLPELFIAENVNQLVEKLREEVMLERYNAYVLAKAKHVEATMECNKPGTCPCINLCHPNLPEYSIYNIGRLSGSKKKIRELVDNKIINIVDVPEDFPLTSKQRTQVDIAQSGQTIFLNKPIQKKLDKLIYPLYFIDYETFNPAVPIHNGYKPYTHITFQYSLHIMRDENSKELEHYEYINTDQKDPIPNFIKSLQKIIGDKGSIITWNDTFEKGRNKEMGEIYPKCAKVCENMNERMFDLMKIFQDQLYAVPEFKGSYSLKNILPVLVPHLSYEGMDIGEGATAMIAWRDMVYGDLKKEEQEKIKQNLLKYCQLDTLAMVEIFNHIKEIL